MGLLVLLRSHSLMAPSLMSFVSREHQEHQRTVMRAYEDLMHVKVSGKKG